MASAGEPPLPPDDASHPPPVPSNAFQQPSSSLNSSQDGPPPLPRDVPASEAAPPLPTGEATLPDFLRASAQPPAEPPLPDFLRGSGTESQNGGSGPSEPAEVVPPTPEEEEALLKVWYTLF
jgi:hypothetical protein